MAKRKKDDEIVEVKSNLHPKEDADEITRLFRVVRATQSDIDSIFNLYKKYVNPKAATYRTNCNCNSSIAEYWRQLLQWFSDNRSLFEQ